MMEQELKERIMKNHDKGVHIDDYEKFSDALDNRSYRVLSGIHDTIVVEYNKGLPALQFEETTGEFIGLEDIDYAKEHGEKL